MEIQTTNLNGVLLLKPKVFGDDRGYFLETWSAKNFAEAGITASFVQDNHSFSKRGTLRGLHYQLPNPQGKLIRVVGGEVFDVAVDLRKSSPTFGEWEGFILSESNMNMLWIPPGFAHGFLVLSETVHFFYKCTDYYNPKSEQTLLWNDPSIAIEWLQSDGADELLISSKDQAGRKFPYIPYFE